MDMVLPYLLNFSLNLFDFNIANHRLFSGLYGRS